MLDLPVFGRGEAGATTGARGVASATGLVGAAAVGRAGAVALPSLPAMRENSPRIPERRAFAGLLSEARRARVDIWSGQRGAADLRARCAVFCDAAEPANRSGRRVAGSKVKVESSAVRGRGPPALLARTARNRAAARARSDRAPLSAQSAQSTPLHRSENRRDVQQRAATSPFAPDLSRCHATVAFLPWDEAASVWRRLSDSRDASRSPLSLLRQD